MIETQKNWPPDWADRIAGAIQSLGFASLTEFLVSMPARPYGEIAGHLERLFQSKSLQSNFSKRNWQGV